MTRLLPVWLPGFLVAGGGADGDCSKKASIRSGIAMEASNATPCPAQPFLFVAYRKLSMGHRHVRHWVGRRGHSLGWIACHGYRRRAGVRQLHGRRLVLAEVLGFSCRSNFRNGSGNRIVGGYAWLR